MRPRRRALLPWLVAAACLALALAPAAAQTDDEQTDEHAERDRLYMERLRKAQAPTPAPADGPPPAEQQRYLAYLDELIRDRNYHAADGERYRVQTDDPRVDPAAVVDLLERFRAFFDAEWSKRLPLVAYDEQSRVFLFWSYHKYNKLLGADFSRSLLRPKGHYGSGLDAVTLHTDSDTPGDLADTVIHEAAHQLFDRRVGWSAGAPPTWLGEGLASFYGYMLYAPAEGFVADRVGPKRVALFREGKPGPPAQAEARLRIFREATRRERSGDSIYAGLLATNDPARFYGDDPEFNYAASWLLVHWLLEGDDGAHAEAFAHWIGEVAAGRAESGDLPAALGTTFDELDAAVTAWARRLKAR